MGFNPYKNATKPPIANTKQKLFLMHRIARRRYEEFNGVVFIVTANSGPWDITLISNKNFTVPVLFQQPPDTSSPRARMGPGARASRYWG
jgi:hypothetical protein